MNMKTCGKVRSDADAPFWFQVGDIRLRGLSALWSDLDRLRWGHYADWGGWCIYADMSCESPKTAIASVIRRLREVGARVDHRQECRIYRIALRSGDLERMRADASLKSYGFCLADNDEIVPISDAWTVEKLR